MERPFWSRTMDDKQRTDSADDSSAIGQIPIAHLIASHPRLIRDLQSIDRFHAVSVYAGLLTVTSLQTCCLRLEAMVHLAVRYAMGDHPLAADMANTAFGELAKGLCGAMEDPAEDAFSTLVTSLRGNYRIVEGIWESAAFFLQRTLSLTERLPAEGWERLSESVFALLALSDAVCERSGFGRVTFGTGESRGALPRGDLGDLRKRVVFTPEDLGALGVRLEAIEPFIFQPSLSTLIPSVSLEHSPLLDYPLLRFGDHIVLALPTAVSVAIRRIVFGSLIDAGLQREGVALLGDEYRRLLQHYPLFGVGIGRKPPIFFSEIGACQVAEYGADIEPGRFVQFIFVLDSLRGFEKTGFVGHAPYEPRAGFISERIAAFRGRAERSATVKEGVTLVVSCGIGRPSFGIAPKLSRDAAGNWDTVFLSAPDAETLTLLEVIPQTVLRICRAKRALARQGVSLSNINGFPNLLAWVRSLDGHLVDHGHMPDEVQPGCLHLILPTNMVLDLRRERAAKVDRHMAPLPDGHLVQICRLSDSSFEDDVARPLYVDERWDDEYGFRLVYRGRRLDCWCEVRPRDADRWKMLNTWLPRIGESLSDWGVGGPQASLLFRVDFDAVLSPESQAFDVPTLDEIADSISVEVDQHGRRVTVRVGEAFEHGLAHTENISESMLVHRMVEGALTLLRGRADVEMVRGLQRVIVPNTDARNGHLFQARRFRDFVRGSIPDTPVVVDPIDEGTDRLGLGWRFRSPDEGANVNGKENCVTFLNDVVRGIEDQLCSELQAFDRKRLVLLALNNHEAAMVTQQQWRTTARANLALRSDRAAGLRTILNKEFENNASLFASRVLVELAVCECPITGGAVPGETDLARLMSKLLLTIHYGDWSDAIFFDAMEPSLRITPLGDIHGNVAFLTNVAEPFGRLAGGVILSGEIDRYSYNFDAPEAVPTINDAFDPRFATAWEAEKGLSIDEYRCFADLLEDLGIANRQAVFRMRWSELAECAQRGLSKWEVIAESLIVRPRSSWREVPVGFSAKDLWPWRLRRQLSLIRRPLVQLDTGPNPEIVVAPGLVRDALLHTVSGYRIGSFPHVQLVSDEMRSWFGTVAKERGYAFTESVAVHVRRLGWESQSEVPVRRILAGRESDRFGDIDVLCWNAEASRVLLLECKDLHFHKSVGEMAEQVQDFRGQVRGRTRDDMRKHIDRTKAIRANLDALRNYLGCRGGLRVESWVVFRHPVPVLLSWTDGDLGVRVTTFDQLSAILSG
jgi:hypothetical protein